MFANQLDYNFLSKKIFISLSSFKILKFINLSSIILPLRFLISFIKKFLSKNII